MDIMKSIAAVEAGPVVPPRAVPSVDKISISNIKNLPFPDKKSLPKKTKKTKKTKSPPPTPENKNTDMFKVIGNPEKMAENPIPVQKHSKSKSKSKKNRSRSRSVSSMGSMSSSSSIGGFSDGFSMGSSMDSSNSSANSDISKLSGSSYADREEFTKQRRKEEIMQEKIEMLTRISKMSKEGFTTTKKWTLKDDIDEIRFECYRMTRENNSRKSVKKMQHILISVATMIEFANGMVNPFNLKLQGFSQNMMLTVSDYDDSLEELHHKWSGRTSFGPEMTIMMTFVSSAIFQHAGNCASTPSQPTSSAPPKKSSGKDMSSVLGMFSNMMPKPKPAPVRSPAPAPTPAPTSDESVGVEQVTEVPKRRTMKRPSANVLENLAPSMTV